jgi:hypothetical protein
VRVVKRNNRAERQNRLHKLIHDTVDWRRLFMKTELRNGFREEDSAMQPGVRSKDEECRCFSTSSTLIQPKEDAKYKTHFFNCFLPSGSKPAFYSKWYQRLLSVCITTWWSSLKWKCGAEQSSLVQNINIFHTYVYIYFVYMENIYIPDWITLFSPALSF